MAFGDSISALLETYTNCIALLKAFRHGRGESSTVGIDPRQRQHSRLRKALKSDRALVERAYSTRLSESGSRFKKGDARAISAVDRILNRLRSAIANLLRLSSKKDGLDPDYESLMSLSNASRVEAIKAIDSLSRRVEGRSRSSVVSLSPSKAHSKTKPSSRRKRKPSSSAEKAPPKQNSPRKSPTAVKERRTTASGKHRKRPGAQESPKAAPTPPPASPQPSETPSQPRTPRPASGGPEEPKPKAPNTRLSLISFSSDSTKLGEIPPRKWPQQAYSDYDGGYNVRPAFPPRPYTAEVKERRFWGLFRRRREG